MVVVHFAQAPVVKGLNLLGSRCAGCAHEVVPVNVVGIQKMDFRHWRLRNEV